MGPIRNRALAELFFSCSISKIISKVGRPLVDVCRSDSKEGQDRELFLGGLGPWMSLVGFPLMCVRACVWCVDVVAAHDSAECSNNDSMKAVCHKQGGGSDNYSR